MIAHDVADAVHLEDIRAIYGILLLFHLDYQQVLCRVLGKAEEICLLEDIELDVVNRPYLLGIFCDLSDVLPNLAAY